MGEEEEDEDSEDDMDTLQKKLEDAGLATPSKKVASELVESD